MRGLVLAACVFASAATHAQQASPFPSGPGREIVVAACTQCHQAGPITQLRMGETAWRRQVFNMVLRGAQIGPGDIDAASAYLAASFGPGVPFPNQAPVAVTLPAGAGAPLVQGGCSLCHGVDRVVATKRSGREWDAIVARMVAIGAPLTPEQVGTVAGYLKANFGVVQTAEK